jgi:uncharacterized MnhB-related membrane protein
MLKIFLILAIVFAFKAINTEKLRVAIINMGIFSLISSFLYLLYSAPDVAIAEAVMGCTLSTILYLVAFQKYRVFSIYYIANNEQGEEVRERLNKRENLLKVIGRFCNTKELESHVIYTFEGVEHIKENHEYDLIVYEHESEITIYGVKDNYLLEGLENFICLECDPNLHYEIEEVQEVEGSQEDVL